jgi:hypothetical protein
MQRLDFPRKARRYFDLHATLDVCHSREWIKEIIRPLVCMHPESAQYLAEGALMRLRCGELCYERYSTALNIHIHKAIKKIPAGEAVNAEY